MKYYTRFNPTANGDLHLGHVYMLLFNERMALDSGGKLFVRFENNQVDTLYDMDYMKTSLYCDAQREAIDWLGIDVAAYVRQSDLDLEFKQFVANHGWFIPEYKWPYNIPLDPANGFYNPEQGEWFPYAPHVTYCKVIYDELAGVNVLIRGDDLRSEFSLYQHYRTMLGLSTIDHYYLPRLYQLDGGIVSKFHGAKSILEYRAAGWTAHEIIGLLEVSTLKNPGGGFKLSNVKRQPRIDEAAIRPV